MSKKKIKNTIFNKELKGEMISWFILEKKIQNTQFMKV